MKLFFVSLSILFLSVLPLPSWACGDNAPHQLEARARAHFEKWDINHNQQLEAEEFLASGGYYLGMNPPDKDWVNFFREKLELLGQMKAADADNSAGLNYEEWLTLRPLTWFMFRSCGD